MTDTGMRGRTQLLAGPALLALALIGGAVALALARAPAWLLGTYLGLAAATALAEALVVVLPVRETLAELSRAREAQKEQTLELKRALEELRHGDLVTALSLVKGGDDELDHAFEAATRSLGALIQQIQNSSVEVATSALSVQEASAELASASAEQAAAVFQITATTEELARTAGQIASNAASQADLASRAEQAGNTGAGAVQAAVAGVGSVRCKIDEIAGRADILGSRSREIYRVLDLVREISQETHILSLNAAIEAASAGSHGDRFAVVADEVRRLAERSRESIESVRTLLEEFSGAIRAVVVATEEGSTAAMQVERQSRSSEEAIEQLRRALADTAQAAREISLATQEQRGASDQVVVTLREVSEVIQRMAASQRQFSGTAEQLNHLALSIQLLAQSFRVESTHSLKHRVMEGAAGLASTVGKPEAVERHVQDVLLAHPYAEMVYLVDQDGVMMAFAVNPDLVQGGELPAAVKVGRSYADRPWFQAVRRDGRTAVTPLYDSLFTGEPCFSIASPVADLDGRSVGTLGLDVNVRNWTRI